MIISPRDKKVRQIILIEGTANLLVLIAKVIVGLSTGSLAVLADAVHSLTDTANNIVAWIVVRLSIMPADKEHPYGHRKFETLAVFGLASLLVVMAFQLALQAITKEESEIASHAWEVYVMISVLVINVLVASWQRMWARRLESDILLADASHTFSDVLITLVVIGGWQLSAMGYVWLDRACALGVAVIVFYLAYTLFKRAGPVLVDQFAIDPEILTKAALEVPGVLAVKRVRSRWIGSSRSVDLIVTVNPDLSTHDAHVIADNIEQIMELRFSVHDISVHIEPHEHN